MRLASLLSLCVLAVAGRSFSFDAAPAPQKPSAADLRAAVDRLGDLDYATRTAAARTLRRTDAETVVPLLQKAALEHKDGYVKYRALVLLAGFNDSGTAGLMSGLTTNPNDRLREVAYSYIEHHPNPALVAQLLAALERETADFVRPALVRALAAHGTDPKVQEALLRDVGRGQDHFRAAVIESLGEYRGTYALSRIADVAKVEGPLQDDALVALGRLGDKRALDTMSAVQKDAPQSLQPWIATGTCLLGVNCASHLDYLTKAVTFAEANSGYQDLLHAAAGGLGVLAIGGNTSAAEALFALGVPSKDPAREEIALALAAVAIKNTPLMLAVLEKRQPRDPAIELLKEGFDMLEEDFEEELFFATVRRGYWSAAAGSPARAVAEALIQKLDF